MKKSVCAVGKEKNVRKDLGWKRGREKKKKNVDHSGSCISMSLIYFVL